jgi:MoaA/NifB/PqqE/SkfB family radical SAM enzyme
MKTSKRFGEIYKGPDHIAFDITNKCNLNCRHCYNRSSIGGGVDVVGRELSRESLLRFADEINSLEPYSFCCCGGEPLLRFDEIIRMMRRLRNPITRVGLVSNGYMLTLDRAKQLAESGIYTIQISVDGATAGSHERLRGVKGAYERAIAAVKNATQAGFASKAVSFCPTSYNIAEFPEVVKQMRNLHVDEIRVQPLMRLGNACQNPEIFPSELQYRILREEIKRCSDLYRNIRIEWGDPIDHLFRSSEIISEFVPYLTVRSNGDIVISPYLPITIGNITAHTVKDYWDAQIWRIWEVSLFKDIASLFVNPNRMTSDYKIVPRIFYEENIKFDLIDDDLLSLSMQDVYELYDQRAVQNGLSNRGEVRKREEYLNEDPKLGNVVLEKRHDLSSSTGLGDLNPPQQSEVIKIVQVPEQELAVLINFYAQANLESIYVRPGGDIIPGQYGTVTRMRLFNDTHRYIGIFDDQTCIGVICVAVNSGKNHIAFCESLVVTNGFKKHPNLVSSISSAIKLMHLDRIFVVLHGDYNCRELFYDVGFRTLAVFKATVVGASGFEVLCYNEVENQ